jgi:signal transduction histidine kinase
MGVIVRLVVCVVMLLALPATAIPQSLPRSVLILDQSDNHSAWYASFSAAFRSTLLAGSADHTSVYAEHLDLSRFGGSPYDDVLRSYLREKYRSRPIGLLVAQGASSLQFLLRSRRELWPGTPIVFAGIDEETGKRLDLPVGVTGILYQQTFGNAVTSAKTLLPNLRRIALVGDAWERQAVRRHYREEIAAFASQFEFIDLLGLPMTEIRKRVSALPDDTAIIYTSVTFDGAGVTYVPHEGLAAFAKVANRPIVIDVETNIGYGGVGGLVTTPVPVGEASARIALRILAGEEAAKIPVTTGDFTRPIFDWRELQRFGISESRLPAGSEIRFRQLSLWDQYRWQMSAILAVVLTQGLLIGGLLFERRRRHVAERELRGRLLEVIHLNRTATAGALSASIAHELNQPLGAIQSSAEAAELYLKADPPNLGRVEQILANIRRDDQRAAQIITHFRGLVRKPDAIELQEFDVNDVVRNAIHILDPEASKRGVELSAHQTEEAIPVRADQVQLQQVILNLAVNGMDAMQNCASGTGKMSIQTARIGDSAVEVCVNDSGTGIPDDKLGEVFETFYTTKRTGTGLGLSIARTIVETYGGKIWAENRAGGGAAFRFTLPLSKGQPA